MKVKYIAVSFLSQYLYWFEKCLFLFTLESKFNVIKFAFNFSVTFKINFNQIGRSGTWICSNFRNEESDQTRVISFDGKKPVSCKFEQQTFEKY